MCELKSHRIENIFTITLIDPPPSISLTVVLCDEILPAVTIKIKCRTANIIRIIQLAETRLVRVCGVNNKSAAAK